jgi:hypothetical protein
MKGLRAAVLTLLAITAVYPVALYVSIKRYEAWKQTELQQLPPEIIKWIEFDPIGIETSLLLTFVGPILASCWVIVIAKQGRKLRSKKLTTVSSYK